MTPLLSVKEFADYIRVHPRSVYRRIWRNEQPGAVKFGREHRIDLEIALKPAPQTPSGRMAALGGMFKRV